MSLSNKELLPFSVDKVAKNDIKNGFKPPNYDIFHSQFVSNDDILPVFIHVIAVCLEHLLEKLEYKYFIAVNKAV